MPSCRVAAACVLRNMNDIHPTARISPLADIETSSRGSKVIIGPHAVIDSYVKVKFAGGLGDVRVGRDSYLNSGCVIYSGHGVTIGDNVLIAANCTLAATNHEFRDPAIPIRLQGFMPGRGGIIIEDDVWIGANCVLLDGSIVRRGAVVSAGTVVRSEVPAYAVIGGNPWRLFKSRLTTAIQGSAA